MSWMFEKGLVLEMVTSTEVLDVDKVSDRHALERVMVLVKRMMRSSSVFDLG